MGRDKVSFGIHKDLLCHVSSYFKAALTGTFGGAITGVVVLRDEEVDVFKRFNGWLYTNTILQENDIKDPDFTNLMELYVFAEKRGIPSLQNAVIDALIRIQRLPDYEIESVWEKTARTSGLHRLLVDSYIHYAEDDVFSAEACQSDFAKDFLIEVIIAFCKARDDGSIVKNFDLWKKRCQYHVHGPDDPPCKGPMPP